MADSYRKASYSNPSGCCIEVGTARKSSFSGYNGNCIEAAQATAGIGVRDTKQRDLTDRTEIEFTAGAWRMFVAGLKGQ